MPSRPMMMTFFPRRGKRDIRSTLVPPPTRGAKSPPRRFRQKRAPADPRVETVGHVVTSSSGWSVVVFGGVDAGWPTPQGLPSM